MGKRKYTHVKELEPVILQMRKEGKTRREIAECLGLTRRQFETWVTRYNRRQAKIAAGIPPKPNGKPAAAGISAIHRKEVRPKAKYHVIYTHRDQYPVQVMCQFFGVSRSGYYAFVKRLGKLL